jgi:hypothetical protein
MQRDWVPYAIAAAAAVAIAGGLWLIVGGLGHASERRSTDARPCRNPEDDQEKESGRRAASRRQRGCAQPKGLRSQVANRRASVLPSAFSLS